MLQLRGEGGNRGAGVGAEVVVDVTEGTDVVEAVDAERAVEDRNSA